MFKASIKHLRFLKNVKRWSIVPLHQKEDVAAHTFDVLCLVLKILNYHRMRNDLQFKYSLVMRVVQHDMGEAVTGDAPSTTKPPKNYTSYDEAGLVLKCADIMDQYLTLAMEIKVYGNKYAQEAIEVVSKEMDEALLVLNAYIIPTMSSKEVWKTIKDEALERPYLPALEGRTNVV